MADIYGSHFEFASKPSWQYGLMIANVETGRMDRHSGDIEGITIFSKSANKRYLIADDLSGSPLSFEVEIITDNQRVLDYSERREIEKWLFNRRDYRKLYIDIADDCLGETFEVIDGVVKRNYLNCRFINPEKLIYQDGVVGYKATLEADSGMFWQDPIENEFNIDASPYSAVVYVDTDIDDFTYPKVTFVTGSSGGDVTIINHSDDSSRMTKFVGLGSNATIVMRGEVNYISGQYYEKFYKQNFVRLVDGENNITVTGDVASITIEHQNRRAF